MSISTNIPKGTRDFLPQEMIRRKYIFNTLEEAFQRFGFVPIETPAMENLATLTGKYGEEGDRLIFKILNSGDFMSAVEGEDVSQMSAGKLSSKICEKALRYDLTVPFARFVVQHRAALIFPFRRYQIQPVWRADRPQRGRYREFFQCDVDVIGTTSLLCEVELLQVIDEVFAALGIGIRILVNNRKVLSGIAEAIGEQERFGDITVAIDKLDKAGEEKVIEELLEKGMDRNSIDTMLKMLTVAGTNAEKAEAIMAVIGKTEAGKAGIAEMREVFSRLEGLEMKASVEFDPCLARGLNYYTGTIIEVKATDVSMGSICGGGRYDDLTGIFGMPGVSGVGVSFGADRIYDVMNELKLFPESAQTGTRVLFANFGGEEERYSLQLLTQLRRAGIPAEIYPEPVKMKKQFAYADDKKIPFVAIIGSEEMSGQKISLKNMATGVQQMMEVVEAVGLLKKDKR